MTGSDLVGRQCVISGVTSGIGRSVAECLTDNGANVIFIARNLERAEKTLDDLRSRARNPNVSFILADLSSQSEVRKAAFEVKGRVGVVDILINNAGAIFQRRQISVDGIEATFALNHLAPFLLTQLLLGPLRRSRSARVVNVGSTFHNLCWERVSQATVSAEAPFNAASVYARSKLANLLAVREFSQRYRDITALCIHPGVVATHFGFGNSWWLDWIMTGMRPFSRSPKAAADDVVHAATAPEFSGASGSYLARRRVARGSRRSRDSKEARALWDLSVRMTGSPEE